jgi:hypothetical protein
MGSHPGMRLLLPVGRSGWAIAAGYFGLFALVIVPAPLALAFGIIAIRDIVGSRNGPNPKHGMGRAIFAIITGTIGTIILAAFLISYRS